VCAGVARAVGRREAHPRLRLSRSTATGTLPPVALGSNRPEKFYAGGARIDAFRGVRFGERRPEDWLASTTTMFGEDRVGLSELPDGRLLRDAIAADPERWLGPGRTDAGLLVKLLDAGQRLPVHAHPDGAFAREHLGLPSGKAEAWLVLEPGPLWVGFREDDELATLDDDAMLARMHELHPERGEWVYVPAGVPHAIGEGAFILEVQEPCDASVLLEWSFLGLTREQAMLGLPLETALASVRTDAADPAPWRSVGRTPAEADPFFRAEAAQPGALGRGYAVVVGLEGSGRLSTEGGDVDLAAGDAVVVPFAAGEGETIGVTTVVCRPPA
jgi:mannose-6-phosphate isomerase